MLMAIADAENESMSTLRLEENLDSVRLNIPNKIYETVTMSITNDSKYIFVPITDND